MKRLILSVYMAVYDITKAKKLAFIVALVFITLLDYFVVNCLVLLMEDWIQGLRVIQRVFSFPYFIFVGLIILAINFYLMPPYNKMTKEAKKSKNLTIVLVYTIVGILAFLYVRYHDKMFSFISSK